MTGRRSRQLHPGAWWLWAIGLAAASSRTTNPMILLLFCAVAALVVANRRSDAPWALGFRWYLMLGLVIIAIRVVFRMLLGGDFGTTVLFEIPEVDLPDISHLAIGGPVTLEEVLAGLYDALRIATMLVCLGAANTLADPKRLLKALPAALYEIGLAVTIALTVAPQLIESSQRIHRARSLRGGERPGPVRGVLIPVLEDALDRSLVLAAAMDSRGYGRRKAMAANTRTMTTTLMLGGLCGICIGTYGTLDATTPRWLGLPMLLIGWVLGVLGIRIGGARIARTVYRRDRWLLEEWFVAACGIVAAAVMFLAVDVDPANLYPSLQPLQWPTIGITPAVAAVLAALPAMSLRPAMSTFPAMSATRLNRD